MKNIFDEEYKLQKWLDVEAAVASARASVGDIPKSAAKEIARNANTRRVTWSRIRQIEKQVHHDLMSMVIALSEACAGEGKKYVHYGLTSNDIEDTATGLQLKGAFNLLEKSLEQFEMALTLANCKHRSHVISGRTRGRDHDLMTFGLMLNAWSAETNRHKERLKQIRERAIVGKILGIVGTGAGMGKKALEIQKRTLRTLGLKPAGLVTQVIQRDIYAEIVVYLALLASSLDTFATELRNLKASEIASAMMPFEDQQPVRGSPLSYKTDSLLCETVSSLAKVLRGLTIPAMENIPLWHERDLSNSANERFLFPISFIVSEELLRIITQLLRQMV
jgi:adenylosuccinate lyase